MKQLFVNSYQNCAYGCLLILMVPCVFVFAIWQYVFDREAFDRGDFL